METAGAMRVAWRHDKYSLLFRSQQTAEEKKAEADWMDQSEMELELADES